MWDGRLVSNKQPIGDYAHEYSTWCSLALWIDNTGALLCVLLTYFVHHRGGNGRAQQSFNYRGAASCYDAFIRRDLPLCVDEIRKLRLLGEHSYVGAQPLMGNL